MNIAVLGSKTSWYLRDLQRAAGDQFEVYSVPFTRLHATLTNESANIGSGDADFGSADAVLVRSMPPGSLEQVVFRMNALATLESSGVAVVNRPQALEIAIDKFLALARLRAISRDAGFQIPETFVCQSPHDVQRAIKILGENEVVMKPIFGGEGRGVRRVRLDREQNELQSLAAAGHVFYLQRFIPHAGRDYRLLVVGDLVLGMQRVNRQDWRTNISLGGKGEPLEVTSQLGEMALKAAAEIGASVCALDIIPADDGRLVALELNAVPGWRALAETTGVDVASLVLDHLAAVASKDAE